MSEAIKSLAANIVERKKAGLEPYVLFLGAGASISSGCSSMLKLVDDVLLSHDTAQFEAWQQEIADAAAVDSRYGDLLRNEINKKKLAQFFNIWTAIDGDSRYAILRKHLWVDKTPSEGYIALAHLIKAQYFSVVLSTNLDNLMEKALSRVDLISPEDFIAVVNGKDSPEEVRDQLENSRIPVKLVKLHGSLESPRSYAFTVEELFNFEKTIKPSLARIINQSLLVVGHSMQDRDINVLFEEEGKEIHFVNPTPPELGGHIDTVLKVRGLGSIIDGADGMFDNFFRQLRSYIKSQVVEAGASSAASSIEGFLRSIGYENELKAPRSRYKNLPALYVKPTEYDDILAKLEVDRILFIIGEPHMGKTYTALYLLWEYYQNGFDTIHIRHDQLVSLLHRHDGDLKRLLIDLFTPVNQRPRIVHLDDPFGETLERRTDAFSEGLDIFLEIARGYEHLRVVVTSRLNIFNEAINKSEIQSNLEELEKTLRVHTSYRRDVLLDILHRYMRFYKPAWANDPEIIQELNEKLPEMLPAPHNIEFFVSTSETLNTIDAVLAHVEESKKMISALAGWMKYMHAHEQLFLMWVDICSTANILFPDTDASRMDIERAFKENLAYLFSEGHIPGIPAMPFSSAKDKFDTILLERRDDSGMQSRIDFVHPSYHEALWYAVNHGFPIAKWWTLLNEDVGTVLSRLDQSIDVVQLKMIERYGTINRDLDQLLLISAESEDVKERLVALDHMLKRAEYFTQFPQFHRCIESLISLDVAHHGMANVVNNLFTSHLKEIRHLGERYPLIQKLILLQQTFNLSSEGNLLLEFNRLLVERWPQPSVSSLRKVINTSELKLGENVTKRILENFDLIPSEYRDDYVEALISPTPSNSLINYIEHHIRELDKLSDNVLIKLLNAFGRVQYEVLTALLIRFERLSKEAKKIINDLIDNPPDRWVGASVGQITMKELSGKISEEIKDLPSRIINLQQKQITGALLSEMVQQYLDTTFGLQEQYKPILQELIRDTEIVKHAEEWMDHSLKVFNFSNEDYWSNIKSRLHDLSKESNNNSIS